MKIKWTMKVIVTLLLSPTGYINMTLYDIISASLKSLTISCQFIHFVHHILYSEEENALDVNFIKLTN